jgi:hypothetical protein
MDARLRPNDELILKVAKNLQAVYSKQTLGEPRKWRDVPLEERKTWTRLARAAARVLILGQGQSSPTNG